MQKLIISGLIHDDILVKIPFKNPVISKELAIYSLGKGDIAQPEFEGLRHDLHAYGVDCFLCIVTAPPRVFLADMDSTMIGQEVIDEIGQALGMKDKIAYLTEQAMQGHIDFKEALEARVALLEGARIEDLELILSRLTINNGADELLSSLKRRGIKTILVSGGFHFFADKIGARLGFDRVVANQLEVKNGFLTGRLEPPIIDANAKLDILEAERQALGLSYQEIIAIGDGANDINMVKVAGHGFAYRAKPALLKEAAHHINFSDLTIIRDCINF